MNFLTKIHFISVFSIFFIFRLDNFRNIFLPVYFLLIILLPNQLTTSSYELNVNNVYENEFLKKISNESLQKIHR